MVATKDIGEPSPWQPITNKLDLAVLGKAAEELCEASSRCVRSIIQGLDSLDPKDQATNRAHLQDEMADVLAQVELVVTHFGLGWQEIHHRRDRKLLQKRKWHTLITP